MAVSYTHLYVEYIVCYHNGRYHTIEHDKGEKQREVAFAVVIIFAEAVSYTHLFLISIILRNKEMYFFEECFAKVVNLCFPMPILHF